MKKCPCCGKGKDTEDFYKNRSLKDGLSAYCKDCQNQYSKEYKEKVKEELLLEIKFGF